MKKQTREEIEREYALRVQVNHETWLEVHTRNREWRDAALAELDDPMARLIAAGKEHLNCRECGPLCISCQKALRDAIYYAEQRMAQG